jgi:hypothetical protein
MGPPLPKREGLFCLWSLSGFFSSDFLLLLLQAAYPLSYLRENKFWPIVGRLDNVYGDRNVICTCPPVESYQ